jgi:hypothetical protein
VDLHYRRQTLGGLAWLCGMCAPPPTSLPYVVIQLLLPESRQTLAANLQALGGLALDRCAHAPPEMPAPRTLGLPAAAPQHGPLVRRAPLLPPHTRGLRTPPHPDPCTPPP